MAKFSEWRLLEVEVPITVTLDPYTANDSVGGELTSDEIDQASGGMYINWVRLVDAADQAEPYTLYVFKAGFATPIVDAAAFSMTNADQLLRLTTIDIPAASYDQDLSTSAYAIVDGKDKTTGEYQVFPTILTGKLTLYLVPSATPDYAAADNLTMHLGLMVM